MTEPSKNAQAAVPSTLEALVADRLSVADRKFLSATPMKSWPKVRLVFVACEEAGELVELISEMNRVMLTCPAIIMSRTGKGELGRDQGTDGYAQLHDSIHSVRNAQHAMLLLAGKKVPEPLAAKAAVTPGSETSVGASAPTPDREKRAGASGGPTPKLLAIARPERS